MPMARFANVRWWLPWPRFIHRQWFSCALPFRQMPAEQHHRNSRHFTPLTLWYFSSLSRKRNCRSCHRHRQLAPRIIAIGAAMFQEQSAFAKLGLAIVDEQHQLRRQ